MNTGPPGFQNAAVTKGVVFTCGIVSLLVGTQGGAREWSLSYQAIVRKLQLWRFVSSNFIFSTTPELMFGLYLIYFFRVFERQLGSNKYLVFLLFSSILTTLLEVVAVSALRDQTSSGIVLSPGPYGFIFASFIPFFFDIPISTRFRVFGAQLSDKSIVYFAGLQLLISSWKSSVVPGICGILAGFAYRSNILGLRRWKFPEGLALGAAKLFRPLLTTIGSSTTSAGSSPLRPDGSREIAHQSGMPDGSREIAHQSVMPDGSREIAHQSMMQDGSREIVHPSTNGHLSEEQFTATPAPLARIAPPEETVSTLVAMGFDRNMALAALARSRNDVLLATNFLLESQLHIT